MPFDDGQNASDGRSPASFESSTWTVTAPNGLGRRSADGVDLTQGRCRDAWIEPLGSTARYGGPRDMMGMAIRRAHAAEAAALAALWIKSRNASVPSIPPFNTEEEVRRWFEETVLLSREVWVADLQGAPVALMVLDHEWIDQLYVDPASTGGGICGMLLEHAMRLRPTGLRL